MPHRPASFVVLPALALVIAMAIAPSSARAASVDVMVTDAAAGALADSVVMLEPVGAHPPVKPMAGAQIAQRNQQFEPRLTVVTVGTPVLFPNLDTVRHHVYSFSPAKTFQIKLYAGVPHVPILFDKAGIAVLGCNIHDQMVAWVVVVDTPYWARTGPAGRARFDGVPPGTYQLRAWHSSLGENTQPVTLPLVVGAADVEQRVRLDPTGIAK